jgi:hypothetical protein
LLERSAAAAGLQDFGLRLARLHSMADIGLVGLLVREEPTVRDAIQVAARYLQLHSSSLALRLDEQGKASVLRVRYLLTSAGRTRQATELMVGTVFRTLTLLVGRPLNPEAICFSHPAPTARTIHAAFFKAQIQFDSAFNGFILRAGDLAAPIRTSEMAMPRYIKHYVEEIVAQPVVTFDATVRRTVFALLPTGQCRSATVAKQLGVNPRRGSCRARAQAHPDGAKVADRYSTATRVFRARNVFAVVSRRVRRQRQWLAKATTATALRSFTGRLGRGRLCFAAGDGLIAPALTTVRETGESRRGRTRPNGPDGRRGSIRPRSRQA